MRTVLIAAWFVLAGLFAASGPAVAEKRVALVIGNGAYKSVPALTNPGNDAGDVAASLKRLGFEVTTVSDANYDAMRRALLAFGRSARGAEIATVFFAGHGMEIGGENWLLPVDAELRSDTDAEGEAINLRMAMLQVAGASKLGLVILDACRNNPFAAKMQRSIRTRTVERGLARTEPTDNVLVAYAARDGTTANDGSGRNSPFTSALLKHVETPGLEINLLFRIVRDDVMAATRREQQPFVYGSLSRTEIFLKPPGAVATTVTPPPNVPPSAAPPAQPASSEAERAWNAVKDSTNTAMLEAFIRRFGDTFYGDMARVRLDEVKKLAAIPAQPQREPDPPPARRPQPAPVQQQPAPAMPRIDSSMPEMRWRLVSSFPKAIPNSAEGFAAKVAQVSGQRFSLTHHVAGEIVPAFEVLDAVRVGVAEAGYTLANYFVGKDPALALLSSVPFGFEPRQHLAWRQRADVKAVVDRVFATQGVVGFPCGAFGRYEDFWMRTELRSADDLRGLKLRIGGWNGRILSGVGGVPQALPAGDLYPALERGAIDGAQWSTPRLGELIGLQKVAKFYYYPGVISPANVIDLIVNKSKWDGLPAAGKQLLEAACAEATNTMLADYEAADAAALRRLRSSGTVDAPLPAVIQKRLFDANQKLMDETAAANPNFKALLTIVRGMTAETVAANIR